ncbi:SH3 domain-containing protein [Herbaspirillum huttiense F1]|uniref:SH3 domain-containing protein n=1 Tax=Herbaspirillum huttiense TaxID=863372 RepID=UPI0028881A58|nr:SH3 domain-containing protein [Herbaspirillum huttiense]MDT0359338.1 SH3 domain-containing protein [Herbaspirillum huttiense F1]
MSRVTHHQSVQALSVGSKLAALNANSSLSALQQLRSLSSQFRLAEYFDNSALSQIAKIVDSQPMRSIGTIGEGYASILKSLSIGKSLESHATRIESLGIGKAMHSISRITDLVAVQSKFAGHIKPLDWLGAAHKAAFGVNAAHFAPIVNLIPKEFELQSLLDSFADDEREALQRTSLDELAEVLDERWAQHSAAFGTQTAEISIQDIRSGENESTSVAASRAVLSRLSTSAIFMWLYLVIPMVWLLTHWEDVRHNLVDLAARLPQTETFAETKYFVQKNFAGKPGDVRLIKGENVYLRAGPSMKSEVILPLKEYSPVGLLQKVDRDWALVSYEHEGYAIDGYVSVKFLRPVAKR